MANWLYPGPQGPGSSREAGVLVKELLCVTEPVCVIEPVCYRTCVLQDLCVLCVKYECVLAYIVLGTVFGTKSSQSFLR